MASENSGRDEPTDLKRWNYNRITRRKSKAEGGGRASGHVGDPYDKGKRVTHGWS
jgi:hypothetical protein